MDRSRHGSYRGLEHYLGSNDEVAEMQVDGIFLGIKVEIVSMDECWY